MVARERIKCAEVEEELRAAREEKEALKGAMRVIEQENGRLKTVPTSDVPIRSDNATPTQLHVDGAPTNGIYSPSRSSSSSPSSSSLESVGNDTIMLERKGADVLSKSPVSDMPFEASPWADSAVGEAQ